MTIFLLTLTDGRTLFYSEGPDPITDGLADPGEASGVRGWLDRRGRSLREALSRSDSTVFSWFRRAWNWLHHWTSPDEPMLRDLRLARRYELVHPSAMTMEEARRAWEPYLGKRRRRHLAWLLVNTLLLPPAVLLALLPGPNVLGYWFAYRAVMHLLATLGIRRASAHRESTTYRPLDTLDESVRPGDEAQSARLAEQLGSPGLPEYLRKESPASSRLSPPNRTEPDATPQLQHSQGDRRP